MDLARHCVLDAIEPASILRRRPIDPYFKTSNSAWIHRRTFVLVASDGPSVRGQLFSRLARSGVFSAFPGVLKRGVALRLVLYIQAIKPGFLCEAYDCAR